MPLLKRFPTDFLSVKCMGKRLYAGAIKFWILPECPLRIPLEKSNADTGDEMCRRPRRFLCAGVSLTTSDVFLTCDTTHRTSLRAKLQLKANSSQCETMPRTPQSRKFGESASPRTPIKLVGSGKDVRCLFCGLDFKISGQNTWRSLKNKELRDRVCRLLEKTPDFDRESTRLCKKCFRRIEAIYKRSKDIEDSKREIVEH